MVTWHEYIPPNDKKRKEAQNAEKQASKKANRAAKQQQRRDAEKAQEVPSSYLERYYQLIDDALNRKLCNCCAQLLPSKTIEKQVAVNDALLQPLRLEPTGPPVVVFESPQAPQDIVCLCKTCATSLDNKRIPLEAVANGLFFGEVPECLKRLNHMEKRMIARVCCFVSIRIPRGMQQQHTRGHAINLFNKPGEIAKKLPRAPSESGIVIVRPSEDTAYAGLCEFTVRPHYIREALLWLKDNNKFYRDVEIDEDVLSQLQQTPTVEVPSIPIPEDAVPTYNGSHQDVENIDPLGPPLETALINEAVDNRHIDEILGDLLPGRPNTSLSQPQNAPPAQQGPVLPTPTFTLPSLTEVVNEYSTAGYVGMAFPWLFPRGTGLPDDVRPSSLSLGEYFKCAVHYFDRRFATDALFVFWATNTLQRSQASGVVKIASSRLETRGYQLSAGLLKEAGNGARGSKTISQEAQKLLQLLVPYFNNVKDSAPFWKARKREVLAMMSSSSLKIKTPSWFVTFSPADQCWPEFFAMVDPTLVGEKLHSLSKQEREQLVADNPDLAILCFHARWQAIFDFVLGPSHPLGRITDWYYKVEYQGRGSPHVHAIFWADLECNVEELLGTPEGLHQLAELIEKYSVAFFPGDVPDPTSPIQKPNVLPSFRRAIHLVDTPEWLEDLKELIASCQVHAHKSTCYKKSKGLNKTCRFNFPFATTPHTVINLEQGETLQKMEVLYKRNHNWINRFNPILLSLWRGNMDCSFIGNPYGVAYYAAAYAAKGEPNRIAFRDSLTKSLLRLGDNVTVNKSLRAVAFAALGAREMSLQECLWILSGFKCTDISRSFVIVNASKPEMQNVVLKPSSNLVDLDDSDQDVYATSSTAKLCACYAARPIELEPLSLCEFAAGYKADCAPTAHSKLPRLELLNKAGWISKRKDLAVVLFFPTISFDLTNEDSAYAILLAHVPWRNLDGLLQGRPTAVDALAQVLPLLSDSHLDHISVAAQQYKVRQAAREERRNDHGPGVTSGDFSAADSSHPSNSVFLPLDTAEQLLFDETSTIGGAEDPLPSDHFRPRKVYSASEVATAQTFVSDQEKLFDERRMAELQQYNTMAGNSQQHARQQKLQEMAANLNADQLLAFKIGMHFVRTGQQLVMSLMGAAGTGKSYLIDVFVLALLLHFGHTGGSWGPVLKTAHTGIAAFNIGGVTLTHAFKLGVKNGTEDPSDVTVKKLQRSLCGLRFLIIDEISMVSPQMLYQLDRRLQLVFANDQPFGGIHILFAGDFFQIPPVQVKGLYYPSSSNGRALWLNCNVSITLRIQQRQQQGDILGDICNRARTGDCTLQDINTLNTRFLPAAIPPDALYTSPTNAAVDTLNKQKLSELNRPVVNLWAQHALSVEDISGTSRQNLLNSHSSLISGESNRSKKFRGLHNHFRLVVGARVILQANAATTLGLVNGATGTVYDFIYNPAGAPAVPHATFEQACAHPELQLPIVLVQFDEAFYRGPSFVDGVDRVVPVCPISFSANGIERTQLPLSLAWGLTVHKVQGLTLGKIAVHLPKVHDRGLAYVAISRVKKLEALFLHCPLKPNIFSLYATDLAYVKEENRRLDQLDAATRAAYAHL